MASAPPPLQPTWTGHVGSTMDALILFEACLQGALNHVPRRPHDRERESLIKSGHVFVYEEHSSGIKRWTDGYNWSPSRILGNYLIYRELERAFAPGEKKKAMRRKKSNGVNKPADSSRSNSISTGVAGAVAAAVSAATSYSGANSAASDPQSDAQRALIGSLVDSYPFKEDGLIKKTISVQWNGVPHHLVSYYNVDDVLSGELTTPSKHPELQSIIPRSGLISKQNFRVPVDQEEFNINDENRSQATAMFPVYGQSVGPAYGQPAGPRSMSLPGAGFGVSPFAPNAPYALPQHFQPQFNGLSSSGFPGAHYAPQPGHGGGMTSNHTHRPRDSSVTGFLPDYMRPPPQLGMESPRRQSHAFDPATTGADLALSPLSALQDSHGMLNNNGPLFQNPSTPTSGAGYFTHSHRSSIGSATLPSDFDSPRDVPGGPPDPIGAGGASHPLDRSGLPVGVGVGLDESWLSEFPTAPPPFIPPTGAQVPATWSHNLRT